MIDQAELTVALPIRMKRNVEPEVMSAEDQARAPAKADIETAHSSYPKLSRAALSTWGRAKSKFLSV